MQIIDWSSLNPAQRRVALTRPALNDSGAIIEQVRAIIAAVRRDGDAAVSRFEREFGGRPADQSAAVARSSPGGLRVSPTEFAAARAALPTAALQALRVAIANVTTFHRAQLPRDFSLETQPGVRCERLVRPLGAVGLYVPAGSAPLPSTAIMLAVPAQIAGCRRTVLCTPARADSRADAA